MIDSLPGLVGSMVLRGSQRPAEHCRTTYYSRSVGLAAAVKEFIGHKRHWHVLASGKAEHPRHELQ